MTWNPGEMAFYTGLLLAYAVLLVLAVRHRIRRGRSQRLLEWALALSALWTLVLGLLAAFTAGTWWGYFWDRVAQTGLVVLALLTAGFAAAFVERKGRLQVLVAVAAVLCLAALALDMRSVHFPQAVLPLVALPVGPVEMGSALLLAAWVTATARAWWMAMDALREVRGYKHRNRLRYLTLALLAFLTGDLLIVAADGPGTYAGFVARFLGFCIVTVALLRYDLPDIRRLSLASLRIILLAALSAILYAVAALAAILVVEVRWGVARREFLLPALLVALLGAAAVDVAVRPSLRRFFDRTVLGRTYDVQRALRNYSQQINLILDMERLTDTTLEWLRNTLQVERAAFILLSDVAHDQVELRVVRSSDGSLPDPAIFRRESRFVAHFQRIGRPLPQYDVDVLTWFQAMPGAERSWLKSLGAELFIPVLLPDRPVALLALGPKASGQPYSEEDMETLMTLAGQTATALENARLLGDLRAVQGDLERLNNELAETNRQLQRLDRVKTDFVTIASHELRTPLSQIFGYSDVLSSMKLDEVDSSQMVAEFLDGITRGARRLKRIVDAMVDISLLETGSLRIRPEPVPLGAVVRHALSTVKPAADERGLVLEMEDLSSLPFVEADSARLEQALVSLLSNAIKFSPDGKRIAVSGRCEPGSAEPVVELAIRDEGIGIDAEQQALIFEKFYRPESPMLHSSDEVRFMGAGPGLGLAIAKGIVEAHGGQIWVESPGRDEARCPGSTFRIRLPAAAGIEE
jgi:signal transduction histidine kinase